MWSLKTNVTFAAVLVAAWLIWGTNYVGNILIPHVEVANAGEEVASAPSTSAPKAAPEPVEPLPVLLAKANIEKGAKIAKKCVSCHTFAKGEKNKVGPNLFASLTRDRAGAQGFKYSSALAGLGGKWSYDDMDAFIKKPKDFLKGTKMAFAGIKKAEDRAALILYLRTFHDTPPALPAQ